MNSTVHILGIAGSIRQESLNKALLHAAEGLLPKNSTLDIYQSLADLPLFNQDMEKDPPAVVTDLKQKIRSADAILFTTPEYNYSVPGVLKNAIDWASRPYGDSAWDGKPVGIMGASISMIGTARAQYHLRQMFVFLNMYPLNQPEVMIPLATEKFDKQGTIIDTYTREKVAEFLQALVAWTIRLRQKG